MTNQTSKYPSRIIASSHRDIGLTTNWRKKRIKKSWDWMYRHLSVLKETGQQIEVGSTLKLGEETILASVALELEIPVHLFLACRDQDLFWDEVKQKIFRDIVSRSKEVSYAVDGKYKKGCITQRSKQIEQWWLGGVPILLLVKKNRANLTREQRRRQENAQIVRELTI